MFNYFNINIEYFHKFSEYYRFHSNGRRLKRRSKWNSVYCGPSRYCRIPKVFSQLSPDSSIS